MCCPYVIVKTTPLHLCPENPCSISSLSSSTLIKAGTLNISSKINNEPYLHVRYAAAEFGASIKETAEAKEAYEVCMSLVYIYKA